MPRFFPCPNKLDIAIVGGRQLDEGGGTHEELQKQLFAGEGLYVLLDRTCFKQAPLIPSETLFKKYQDEIHAGICHCLGYYAIPSRHQYTDLQMFDFGRQFL